MGPPLTPDLRPGLQEPAARPPQAGTGLLPSDPRQVGGLGASDGHCHHTDPVPVTPEAQTRISQGAFTELSSHAVLVDEDILSIGPPEHEKGHFPKSAI